jgi:anti-sigma B factor antagonist
MPLEPLQIEDLEGSKDGQRVLRLTGPVLINNLFEFQAKVRANVSPALIIDLSNVPYMDSAGIGALVGAYVTHQKDGKSLALVGVTDRVRSALSVTRVDSFFRFFPTIADAEQAAA